MSRSIYEKAPAAVNIAKENRKVRPILKEMNVSGNVCRAHRIMQEAMWVKPASRQE